VIRVDPDIIALTETTFSGDFPMPAGFVPRPKVVDARKIPVIRRGGIDEAVPDGNYAGMPYFDAKPGDRRFIRDSWERTTGVRGLGTYLRNTSGPVLLRQGHVYTRLR
jgi:hypothetical protein